MNSKDDMFKIVGKMLKHGTIGNRASPPIAVAYDLHGSHSKVDRALLGLLSNGDLQHAEFFSSCYTEPLDFLECFPFGLLRFGERKLPMFGHNDAPHFRKRFVTHMRGGVRKIRIGATWVDLTCLLLGGLCCTPFMGTSYPV